MKVPSFPLAFEVLCLQASDEGREEVLFGDCVSRVRAVIPPFIVGTRFPSVYFEFPLLGDPFMDVTVLYGELEPGTRIDSPVAQGSAEMLDWFSAVVEEHPDVSCGFELDTKDPEVPTAAIHFQPRKHVGLVEPFCAVVGEPERAKLYLDQAKRMPEGWALAFFGMFRGRPGSPLRVCGYLDDSVKERAAEDPRYLAGVFDEIGFAAYDDQMLAQVSELMAAAPGSLDYQFDVYPDGSLGDTLGIDAQFEIEQPEAVWESFENGAASKLMQLFEQWGTVDSRWRLGVRATFARAIPVEGEDGSLQRYSFTLMPQWIKARWKNGTLQPSKLYFLGKAGLLEQPSERD